jgi:hypothetical protein
MVYWDVIMSLPLWADVVLLLYSLACFFQFCEDIHRIIREILEWYKELLLSE